MHGVLRGYWYPVARSADIRDKPVAAMLLDEPIVLFRTEAGITALRDLCIHRGTPLSLGWLGKDRLVCAYHGWEYGTDGACLHIPSLAEGKTIPRKARVTRYQVQQRYGLVWVCLEDEPTQPAPPYPPYDDTARATMLYSEFRWQANAARVCENVLDFTHLPWVHDGMLGSRAHPVYPYVEPVVYPDGIGYDLPDPANDTVRHYRVYGPFTVSLDVRSNRPEGHNYWMLFTCAPVSSRETVQWFFTSRDWDLHRPDHDWEVFDAIVMEQDRRIVESQRPEELPLDLSEELHLRGSDAGTLAYRRYLRELGVAWHH
jgi:phenylpropionate dioxygenase-like ring-hydroxylating dioxygenase large terminal subunit